MKVLIDTHIAIWAVLNDPKLPERARDIILDRENEIFLPVRLDFITIPQN